MTVFMLLMSASELAVLSHCISHHHFFAFSAWISKIGKLHWWSTAASSQAAIYTKTGSQKHVPGELC